MIEIIIGLVVVGFVLYAINNWLTIDGKIKTIINFVVVLLVILWLLGEFGVIGKFPFNR